MKSFTHPRVFERGILTSAYKQEIKSNVHQMRKESLCAIKSKIHNTLEVNTNKVISITRFSVLFLVIAWVLL